jgi:hypothetical protein
MTTHTSRAQRLAQIARQLQLVDFQLGVYARHGKDQEADAARAAGWALRLQWLETKWELCRWMVGRKRV